MYVVVDPGGLSSLNFGSALLFDFILEPSKGLGGCCCCCWLKDDVEEEEDKDKADSRIGEFL